MRTIKPTWLAIGATALLAGLLPLMIAGCGKQNGGDKNVLRYAIQSAPTTLDPALVQDGDTIDLLMQIFEGLVQWNEKNEIVPNIAEKWDLSPDGRTYTFHLRKDVKFHNGRPLVAGDFVYSMTRVLLPATKSGTTAKTYLFDIVGAADVFDGKTATLAGVKALDDHTLQITIDKRRPYFLGKLTYPTAYAVCREAIEKNGNVFGENTMIGTGPFMLQSYQAGYSVSLRANPDYHGGRPKLDGIKRRIITDSGARQAAYESGELDITDVDRADLSRVMADPVLSKEIREYARPAIWYLALNQQKFAPFKDKRVRQAFAMAINKEELVKIALKGKASVANGILPPGVAGCDPNFKGLPYDPAKARKLLADAGFPGGRNFPILTINYRQGYKQIEDGALAIRNDLKQNLGINVDVQQVEWNQFLKQRDEGTMDCYHLRWMADYLDPQDFLSVMLHTGATENGVGYSNPEFDRLCDQADVEGDTAKRIELYHQAERLAVDDAPWVCLYFQHDVELQKPYVHGLRDSAMGHLPHVTDTVAH